MWVVQQGGIPGFAVVGSAFAVGTDARLSAFLLLKGALAGGGKAAPPAFFWRLFVGFLICVLIKFFSHSVAPFMDWVRVSGPSTGLMTVFCLSPNTYWGIVRISNESTPLKLICPKSDESDIGRVYRRSRQPDSVIF